MTRSFARNTRNNRFRIARAGDAKGQLCTKPDWVIAPRLETNLSRPKMRPCEFNSMKMAVTQAGPASTIRKESCSQASMITAIFQKYWKWLRRTAPSSNDGFTLFQ